MADPLSISAGIAGLVTLADAIFRGAFHYSRTAKGALAEVAGIATETQNLAGILHRLSLLASALEIDAPESSLRLHHIISCRQLLLRVEKSIAKAKPELESSRKRDVISRSLKWPFSATETKEILREITWHKETLSLALSADSMAALCQSLALQDAIAGKLDDIALTIKGAIEITTKIRLNDERRRVLDSFVVIDPRPRLEQSLKLRHPFTGLWLIEGEAFQQWLINANSKLWLSGIPGAGKTILAGAMVQEVLKLSSETVGVGYFFCEYTDTDEDMPLKILSCLASQLARQNMEAYLVLEGFFKKQDAGLGFCSTLRFLELLRKLSQAFEAVYLIIDGLDECGKQANEVASIFTSISDLDDSPISVAILSRHEMEIHEVLISSFHHLDVEAYKDDVRLYVAAEIQSRIQSKRLRLRNMAIKDEIMHVLIDKNGGM
jgi:hypothetical protein